MVMRSDPFRELDRLTRQVFGTRAQPAAMPMDAYRKDDTFYIELDLPGIDTTLPVLLDGPHRGAISYERVVEVYSERPARIYGLWPAKGRVGVGADAEYLHGGGYVIGSPRSHRAGRSAWSRSTARASSASSPAPVPRRRPARFSPAGSCARRSPTPWTRRWR